MRGFIHGLKSLVRRPAKTGMLFIILFVVFNLIFTGFIIQNSIARSKEYIRSQIGSAVEYRIDFTAFRSNNQGQNERPAQMTSVPALSIKVAEQIAANHYVKSYYLSEAANVNSSSIDPAQTQDSTDVFQRNFSDFTLSGTNNIENLDFALGNIQLTSGRSLTSDDLKNGTAVVIVSEDVAKANNLRIGDMVGLSKVTPTRPGQGGQNNSANNANNSSNNTNNSANNAASVTAAATESEYEVIGIYKAVEDSFNVNTMFTSNTVINDLNGTAASDETTGSIVYLLDTPDHVAAFKTEATPLLTSQYHTLYSDDTEYVSLTKPLNLISFITSILIWVVFIAGAAIIMALVTIFVRDRKFEIGLLLSSGEGRMKIIAQFVFEILIIAIFAFIISALSSTIAARGVSSWIVDNELLSSNSLINSSTTDMFNNLPNQFRGFMQNTTSLYGAVDMQSIADKFNVAVNGSVFGTLLMASIVLILFGSSIPLIIIMGYRPKRIMQEDN
jgi:putative ABC transport system permease protein